jgi:FMN phosphatase YigB (HAD superfamily)
MPPKFLYFDLGNVLLFFDHQRAARQLAEVAGCSAEQVYDLVFRSDLNERCDGGSVDRAEFCREFRRLTKCNADDGAIVRAASEIFSVNVPMKAIVSQLRAAGHRLGILSNTCDMHYDYFADGRYAPIPSAFEVVVLSYRLKSLKPNVEIYLEAARRAGVAPHRVFYTDDKPENVEGACRAGFDAVLFTTAADFAAQLRRRDIRCNY